MSSVYLSPEAVSGRLDRLKTDMPQLYQTFVLVARGAMVEMACKHAIPHKDAEFVNYEETGLSGQCLPVYFSPNELNLLKELGLVCEGGQVIPPAHQLLGIAHRDLKAA